MKSCLFFFPPLHLCLWIVAVWLAATPSANATIGIEPNRNPIRRYIGGIDRPAQPGTPNELIIEIEPVAFFANSIGGRWKMVCVRIVSHRKVPIMLSAKDDGIEMLLGNGMTVQGTFALRAKDSASWESLSASLRQQMAYPESIAAADAFSGRGEAAQLFAFFPAAEVTDLPSRFCLRIASLRESLVLQDEEQGRIPTVGIKVNDL